MVVGLSYFLLYPDILLQRYVLCRTTTEKGVNNQNEISEQSDLTGQFDP
jgi:hypothetical protein